MDITREEALRLHLLKPLKERIRDALAACPADMRSTSLLYAAMEDARAEIERLERELATFARASVDLSNQLVMCKRERDALTDRMITAGLMS